MWVKRAFRRPFPFTGNLCKTAYGNKIIGEFDGWRNSFIDQSYTKSAAAARVTFDFINYPARTGPLFRMDWILLAQILVLSTRRLSPIQPVRQSCAIFFFQFYIALVLQYYTEF